MQCGVCIARRRMASGSEHRTDLLPAPCRRSFTPTETVKRAVYRPQSEEGASVLIRQRVAWHA